LCRLEAGNPGRESEQEWIPLPVRNPHMNLPTGTVTFLFTDIEGSTRLWEEQPDAMRLALARHNTLVADAIARTGGEVFKTIGDAFCAAFARAEDAVCAAASAQYALQIEPWPDGAPIRVRMAVHVGAADLDREAGDYVGPALNRTARLLAIGHGGQILLSDVAHDLCQDSLPPGCTLMPLGEHRLKDLGRSESVFQLCHSDLVADFPPLRSLDHPELPNNLPQQVSSFIGREKELEEVKALLEKSRLVTLTGSGGCGKTRLAVQAAADMLDGSGDGVWLVELAAISDPALVPQAVASELSLKEEPGKALGQTLTDHLKVRRLLLVVDNCEHLLDACARLADAILRRCPNVRVLATSREGLGIEGELTYRVPSLSLPDPGRGTTPEALSQFEAVRLFTERAQFHKPDFALTNDNASAVASVCHRLDGIPLAIELAAARVSAMPVDQIEHRLDQRFRLLTGGSRTALPRLQTLRSLIDWSYDLLTEAEKALLRRLSVFAGGWTAEAAEEVCRGDGVDQWETLDLITGLVTKSLVLYEEVAAAGPDGANSARYRLLETVRQYAMDRLLESGEAAAVRGRHVEWFLDLAERARAGLFGSDQSLWLYRLDAEHDNLRASLTWSATQESGEAGLRFGAALWRFWSVRGLLAEGRGRLHSILSHPGATAHTAWRARALDGAGLLAMNCGDFVEASRLYEEALSIGRELEDASVIAMACNSLGDVRRWQSDAPAARSLYEEALYQGRAADDRWNVAYSLTALGILAGEENAAEGRALLEAGLEIKRELGDKRSIAYSLGRLADNIRAEDISAARTLYEESRRLSEELTDKRGIAWALVNLGLCDRAEGSLGSAWSRFAKALEMFVEVGDTTGCGEGLQRLSESADTQGSAECVARLAGAAHRLRDSAAGNEPAAPDELSLVALRSAFNAEQIDAAWKEGRSMSFEQAVHDALTSPFGGERVSQ
jgi:predicted ATPase/class 3 adenylate cyclase